MCKSLCIDAGDAQDVHVGTNACAREHTVKVCLILKSRSSRRNGSS